MHLYRPQPVSPIMQSQTPNTSSLSNQLWSSKGVLFFGLALQLSEVAEWRTERIGSSMTIFLASPFPLPPPLPEFWDLYEAVASQVRSCMGAGREVPLM